MPALLEHIWTIFVGFVVLVVNSVGLDYASLSATDQARILASFAATLATLPFFTLAAVQRVRLLRYLFFRETSTEGYWLEKVSRPGQNFVTLIQIQRRFINNRYTIYGETLDYQGKTFDTPEHHAKFKSDSLHFEVEDEILLTYNYSGSVTQRSDNHVGIARYEFPKFSNHNATGWFVGVLDGNSSLRPNIRKDTITVMRLTRWDWLKNAAKEKVILKTFAKWQFYLAHKAFLSMPPPSDENG